MALKKSGSKAKSASPQKASSAKSKPITKHTAKSKAKPAPKITLKSTHKLDKPRTKAPAPPVGDPSVQAKHVLAEIVDSPTSQGGKSSGPTGPSSNFSGTVNSAAARKVEAVEFFEPDELHPNAEPELDWEEETQPKKPRKLARGSAAKTATKALVPTGSRALTTTTDPITTYLSEVRKYPLLTKEQEYELAKHYFESKDPAAAQALVTANLRFVVKVAAEYSKFGARLIDLVQEGNMGLMHAVREFNPYKGVRLITYAVWWIRGYIQEYLLKQHSMVKIATTVNQKKLFYRLQKEKDALDAMGEAPNMKLISQRMDIPVEEVEQMANRLSGRDISLNQPIDEGSMTSLMDLQKSNASGVDDQIAAHEEVHLLREKLEEMRSELSDREKIILEERLLADEPLTLQEIGEKYGITREAVRQMEARLMKKIRDRYIASLAPEDET